MIRALVVGAVLCAACNSDSASTDETLATPSPRPKKGSGGGFTASLSADLAKDGPGSGARTAGTATGDSSATNGSAAGAGSAVGAGSAPSGSAAPGAGSATPAAGSATPAAGTGSGSAKAVTPTPGAGSGSAKAVTPTPGAGSGSAKAVTPTPGAGSGSAKAVTPTPGAGSGSAKAVTPAAGTTAGSAAAPRPPVVLTPELKAIQLSLLPNWKRDDGEAATISLFVDVQSRGETAVFRFHYGYDDPRAPADRDAYKKFLGDAKILSVAADRQRGAAWYLEGADATGRPAFRIVVTYGGKRLVCYGSLYKDSPFGDIRDEVIIQAKKICETIQL